MSLEHPVIRPIKEAIKDYLHPVRVTQKNSWSSPVVQWVKVLSVLWFGSLLWHRFDPWLQELRHAACAVKKNLMY